MKSLIALLLCGIFCAFASPPCSDESAQGCIKTGDRTNDNFLPETPTDLGKFCKDVREEIDCQIDFTDRCPSTLLAMFRQTLKDADKVFKRLCDNKDPLQRKYLDHISCIKKLRDDVERKCREETREQDFCKKSIEELKCVENKIINGCGREVEELVTEMFKPKYTAKKIFCE